MKVITSFPSRSAVLRKWATIGACGLTFCCSTAGRAQSLWDSFAIVVVRARTADGSTPKDVEVKFRPVTGPATTTLPPEPKVEGSNGEWVAPKVVTGNWEVSLNGSNYAKTGPSFLHIARGGNYSVAFMLYPAVKIKGRVLDGDSGAPVAGARVSADKSEAVTDERGNFEVLQVTPGTDSITAAATNLVAQRGGVTGATGSATVTVADFHLHRGGWISGRLVLPPDAPAGATANVVPRIEGGSPLPNVIYPEGAVSSNGTFRIGPLPPGSYRLQSISHPADYREGTRPTWLAGGEVTGLKVEAGGETSGVVIQTRTTWPRP